LLAPIVPHHLPFPFILTWWGVDVIMGMGGEGRLVIRISTCGSEKMLCLRHACAFSAVVLDADALPDQHI
jgi:hypothetical protein